MNKMPDSDLYVLDFDILDLPDSIIVRYFNDAVRETFTDSFGRVEGSEACNGKGYCSPFQVQVGPTITVHPIDVSSLACYSRWTLRNQLPI